MSGPRKWRTGGCHCGAVRFEVLTADRVEAKSCNCSMCRRTGYVHLVADDEDFRITKGEDQLISYRFNSGVANHLFCRHCGIKSFYRPRSRPEGWSVHLACLDKPLDAEIKPFDGANWETAIEGLSEHDRSLL